MLAKYKDLLGGEEDSRSRSMEELSGGGEGEEQKEEEQKVEDAECRAGSQDTVQKSESVSSSLFCFRIISATKRFNNI